MTRLILPGLQQQAQPAAVDAAVVAHDGQVAGALVQQRLDEEPGDAGQPEAADRQAGAVGDVGHGFGGRADDLVQSSLLLQVFDERGRDDARLLGVGQVGGLRHDEQPRAGYRGGDLLELGRRGGRVVGAGDR